MPASILIDLEVEMVDSFLEEQVDHIRRQLMMLSIEQGGLALKDKDEFLRGYFKGKSEAYKNASLMVHALINTKNYMKELSKARVSPEDYEKLEEKLKNKRLQHTKTKVKKDEDAENYVPMPGCKGG